MYASAETLSSLFRSSIITFRFQFQKAWTCCWVHQIDWWRMWVHYIIMHLCWLAFHVGFDGSILRLVIDLYFYSPNVQQLQLVYTLTIYHYRFLSVAICDELFYACLAFQTLNPFLENLVTKLQTTSFYIKLTLIYVCSKLWRTRITNERIHQTKTRNKRSSWFICNYGQF